MNSNDFSSSSLYSLTYFSHNLSNCWYSSSRCSLSSSSYTKALICFSEGVGRYYFTNWLDRIMLLKSQPFLKSKKNSFWLVPVFLNFICNTCTFLLTIFLIWIMIVISATYLPQASWPSLPSTTISKPKYLTKLPLLALTSPWLSKLALWGNTSIGSLRYPQKNYSNSPNSCFQWKEKRCESSTDWETAIFKRLKYQETSSKARE